jgi:hypothetical protein
MMRKRSMQPGELDADVHQITEALAKIRDPLAKYFFAMFVDLMAERIAVMMDANEIKPRLPSRTVAARRAFNEETAQERVHHS